MLISLNLSTDLVVSVALKFRQIFLISTLLFSFLQAESSPRNTHPTTPTVRTTQHIRPAEKNKNKTNKKIKNQEAESNFRNGREANPGQITLKKIKEERDI
jgi:hypothetical protein